MKIEKKINRSSFERILSGSKTCEIRLQDFECNPGDILILKEWNSGKKEFTGRVIEKEITDVEKVNLNDWFWPKEEIETKGLQIISFKESATIATL